MPTIFNSAAVNHAVTQSYVINCISIQDTLNNTNIAGEATRAVNAETQLESQLQSFMSTSTSSSTTLATTVASHYTQVEAQLSTLTSNVSTIVQKSTADEALSSAEVARATAAEQTLTTEYNTVSASLATETNRAESAEAVLTLNVAANSSAIASIQSFDASATYRENSLSSAVQSLNVSRTSDEASIATNTTNIASLSASRTADESTISALHVSQSADAANIATNLSSINSLQSQVSNLSSNVSTSTLAVSGNLSAGSINTALVECDSNTLALVATHGDWGTTRLLLSNASGHNGILLDNSNSPIEVSEIVLKTSTSNAKLSFNKMPGSEIDSNNAPNGEFHISTGDSMSLYAGQSSSGLLNGDFKVLNGKLSDVNDIDELLVSYWSNAFDNINANIRLVRKGSTVCVTLSNFLAQSVNTSGIAVYNLAVPAAFLPALPIQCAVVVTTNGSSSIGFISLSGTGIFSIGPFNGSWSCAGGLSGIGQPTCFSYNV